jgi:hypothetical protein
MTIYLLQRRVLINIIQVPQFASAKRGENWPKIPCQFKEERELRNSASTPDCLNDPVLSAILYPFAEVYFSPQPLFGPLLWDLLVLLLSDPYIYPISFSSMTFLLIGVFGGPWLQILFQRKKR